MLALGRLVVCASVPLGLLATAPALAQAAASQETAETIDDPKLERRLGARVGLVAGLPPASGGAPPGEGLTGPRAEAVAVRPPAAVTPAPRVPHLKVAYRRFAFAQIGATAKAGPAASEPFSVVSLDIYPISSFWRFGLSTQYGWEEGTFRANGDAFIAQSAALGGQIPGPVFTPFFEVHAGGGYMQRTHAGLNVIGTAYGQVGVDVGTELFLARHAFLSAAVGFLRGTNGFAKDNELGSFSVNAWTFKLGFGI